MLSITKCLAIKPAPKRPGHACVLIRRNARSRAHSSRSETDSRRRVPRACSRKSAAVVHCPLVRTRGNGQNAKRLDSSRQKKEGAKTETERGREREKGRGGGGGGIATVHVHRQRKGERNLSARDKATIVVLAGSHRAAVR